MANREMETKQPTRCPPHSPVYRLGNTYCLQCNCWLHGGVPTTDSHKYPAQPTRSEPCVHSIRHQGCSSCYQEEIAALRAELETVKRERDNALDNADFWERELNNLRRNAAYRAEELAREKVEVAESQAARLKEALEKEWKSIDNPPISPDGSGSVCVLGMLEDGTHVFAHYTPFYLGKEDESKYLWVCDKYPWATKPKWWQYFPEPPIAAREALQEGGQR